MSKMSNFIALTLLVAVSASKPNPNMSNLKQVKLLQTRNSNNSNVELMDNCAYIVSKMKALVRAGSCSAFSTCSSSSCINLAKAILAVPGDGEYGCYTKANIGEGIFPTSAMDKYDIRRKQTAATKILKQCNETIPALATNPPTSTKKTLEPSQSKNKADSVVSGSNAIKSTVMSIAMVSLVVNFLFK